MMVSAALFYVGVIYVGLFLISHTGSIDNVMETVPINRILTAASKLCPGSRVCNATANDPGLVGQSCCADCSCDSTCNLRDNCCFPHEDEFREMQSCLWTSLKLLGRAVSPVMYYMTTQCPPDVQHLHPDYTDCGNTQVAFWGSLYPVYSPFTGRIYKNNVCAECHNVTDGVLWEVEVTPDCHWMPRNLDPGMCNLRFIYDKDNRKLPHKEECGITCNQSEFDIPNELNTTFSQDDIVKACHSGFVDHYYQSITYKNAFCAICNSKWPEFGASVCPLSALFESSNELSWTMHEIYARKIRHENDTKGSHPKACRTNDLREISNCVELHCPYRQFYDDHFQCIHLIKHWYNDGYSIALRVRLNQPVQMYLVREEIYLSQWFVSPWPKHWVVQKVYYDKGGSFAQLKNTPSIIVFLKWNTQHRLEVVLNEIAEYLPHPWYVNINRRPTTRHAQFLEYRDIKPVFNFNNSGETRHVPDFEEAYYYPHTETIFNLPPKSLLFVQLVYQIQTLHMFYMQPLIAISKLYFCPLVHVKVNTTIYPSQKLIIYNGSVLLGGEFKLSDRPGGVMICQHDSPYTHTVSASISYQYQHHVISVVITLIVVTCKALLPI